MKNKIIEHLNKLSDDVSLGYINAFDALIELKELENALKTALDVVKDAAKEEAENYDEKTIDYKGFEFTKISRRTYDFKACESSQYNLIAKKETDIKAKKKEYENFLKSLKNPVADAETGEMIYPPAVKFTDIVTLRKKKTK